ncbi:MAG: hypothetical protein AB8B82_06555 [Roseovarius sp.]
MRYFALTALCAFAVSTLCTLAAAQPTLLWSRPMPNDDMGVIDLVLVPQQNRAIAAVGDFDVQHIWVLHLDTGDVTDVIKPITARYGGIERVVANEAHIAVLINNGAGIKDREFHVLVYDAKTLALRHTLAMPDDLPGYNPLSGEGALWLDGDHLLLGAQLWETYQNTQPLLLHFDLTTGALLRQIAMADMLSKADDSDTRPATPDYFFAGAVVTDGMLYATPLPSKTPEPIRPLSYDLNTGQSAQPLGIFDATPRFASLLSVDDRAAIYGLVPPFSTSNVVSVGTAQRVDHTTGKISASYPDPFAPEDTDLSFREFMFQNIETGQSPYTGSWYPEQVSVDGGYVVASAPNAPAGGPVGSGALVVYLEDGTPYTILASQAPKADLFFGRGFVHRAGFVLVADKNPASDYYAARSLVLYTLD